MNFTTIMKHHWVSLIKQAAQGWIDDNALRLSAALAFYSIFSIAPLLVIAIGIVGLVLGDKANAGQLFDELKSYMGAQSAEAIQALVQGSSRPTGGALATVLGLVVLMVGASGVFRELKDALNTIWGVGGKSSTGVKGWLRGTLLSFGMVLVIGFLLLVSLVISTAIAGLNQRLESVFQLPAFVWATVAFMSSLALVTALFALIFKVLPDAPIRWRHVWLGAFITALLFEVGKTGLSWYLGREGAASVFGAAGSVVLLLLWVYYTSCILFFGAEFTRVYSETDEVSVQPAANSAHVENEFHPGDGLETFSENSVPAFDRDPSPGSPLFSHQLVAPILKYIEGRGLLLSIEAREALQQVSALIIFLTIAVVAIFAGWLLLATALVGVLTSYLGWYWVKAAAIAGGTHILIALVVGLLMWKRITKTGWFADTLNELKKDRTWLHGKTTKS